MESPSSNPSSSSSSESTTSPQAPVFSPVSTESTFSPSSDSSSASQPWACTFSARSHQSKPDLLGFIKRILESKANQVNDLHFTDIPPDLGPFIITWLDENSPRKFRKTWNSRDCVLHLKMPTAIHNCVLPWFFRCCSDWLRDGIITRVEQDGIHPQVGTTSTLAYSPYTQSSKEPDLLLRPKDGERLPSMAVEVGWSEGIAALEANCELLLRGSGGTIKVVVLIKWTLRRRSQTVSGEASVWMLNSSDQPIKRQTEVIFPRPIFPTAQGLVLTRGQIWRGSLEPTRNPDEVMTLDIDLLREEAVVELADMGLRPAV